MLIKLQACITNKKKPDSTTSSWLSSYLPIGDAIATSGIIFCNMSFDTLKFMNKILSSGILNPNDENYFAVKVLDISRTSVIEQKNIEPEERL